MDSPALARQLQSTLGIELPEKESRQNLENRLASFVNHLILTDFARLVQLLYRIDVPEARLKSLLREHPDKDAALIIAHLIIEREEQKMKSREQFKRRDGEGDW